MVSKNTILISVHKSTKENLDKIKIHPSLSYNVVIVGLINFWKDNYYSPTPEEIKFTKAEDKTDTSTGN